MPTIGVEISKFNMDSGRPFREGAPSMKARKANLPSFFDVLPLAVAIAAHTQSVDSTGAAPSFGSIATSRPINPATETTNPSARATQTLNPYLGSTPDGKVVGEEIKLGLESGDCTSTSARCRPCAKPTRWQGAIMGRRVLTASHSRPLRRTAE